MAAVLDEVLCFSGMSLDLGTTLVIGWIVFALFLILLGVFVYNRHLKPRKADRERRKEGDLVDQSSAELAGDDAGGALGGRPPGSSPTRVVKFVGPMKSGKLTQTAIVSGVDKDAVDWVNSMINWVYNDPAVNRCITDLWMKNLNNLTSSAITEHGVHVAFEKIEADSLPPTINNAAVEVTPKDDITLTFNAVISKLGLIVNTSRQKGDTVLTPVYQATITNYAGRLKASCNAKQLATTVKFVDHPNLHIALKPISGHQSVEALDEQALQDVLAEIITNALSTWALNLNFNQFHNCPIFRRSVLEADPVKPIHYDSMMTPLLPPIPPRSKKDKRLLVKVIKAIGLGTVKGCQEPYCIVEIDEPPQKHQTSYITGTSNPLWDEHFLFDLNSHSTELLFEIYDKSKSEEAAFLGLGIISVDDLLKNPSQRQIIPLQNRPYEKDDVSGSLTVEFLFMDAGDISLLPEVSTQSQPQPSPVSRARIETNRLLTPGGAMVTTTTTTISKPTTGAEVFCSKLEIEKVSESIPAEIIPEANEKEEKANEIDNEITSPASLPSQGSETDLVANGGDPVTDTALRELENRQFVPAPPSTTTNKSTLIIHSVQRVEKTKNGKFHEVTQPPEVVIVDGDKLLLEEQQNAEIPGTTDSIASSLSSRDDSGRSRPKERRSFMNNLRKRFSFRNKRSKSMEQRGEHEGDLSGDESMSRSASADRARGIKSGENYLGVPGAPRIEVGSTRSSLSETSGVSESSTQTYLSEMSTLVIETIENGITKHYLLPASMARKSKWRKKGTKLHIYNDHIFVAKHFPGTMPCQVCSKNMPRRIGKQGYECRDCHLRCHKMCHVKTESPCQESTVNLLELSYEAYYAANKLHGNNALPVANGHSGSPNAVLHRRPLSVGICARSNSQCTATQNFEERKIQLIKSLKNIYFHMFIFSFFSVFWPNPSIIFNTFHVLLVISIEFYIAEICIYTGCNAFRFTTAAALFLASFVIATHC